jgi:hypothetical protein
MEGASNWIAHYSKFWTDQLDALDQYLKLEKEEVETE